MSSREYIANLSLVSLGADPIDDFADNTNEARAIRQFYDPFIRHVFRTPPAGWSYQFIRPDEAMHIFKVFDTGSSAQDPISDYDTIEDLIVTNRPALSVQYSVYKAEATWPGYFQTFAWHALKAIIAQTITDSKERADDAFEMAYGTKAQFGKGGYYAVAVGADARQAPPQQRPPSPMATAYRRPGALWR
jgi:hypothetical protein